MDIKKQNQMSKAPIWISAAIAASIALIVTILIGSYFSKKEAEYKALSRELEKEETKQIRKNYEQTGIFMSDEESLINFHTVKSEANRYAKIGAWFGGIATATVAIPAAIVTGGSSLLFGGVGATSGACFFGRIGYVIGFEKKLYQEKKQWENILGKDFDKIQEEHTKRYQMLQKIKKSN